MMKRAFTLPCRCPFPFPMGKCSGGRQLRAGRAWSCPHLKVYHSFLMNMFIILWGLGIFSISPFPGRHIALWGPAIHFGALVRGRNSLVYPSPGVNECRDFGWGYLSSARRAGEFISRMGSKQPTICWGPSHSSHGH